MPAMFAGLESHLQAAAFRHVLRNACQNLFLTLKHKRTQVSVETSVSGQLAYLATATQETANGQYVDYQGCVMDW